MVPAFIGLGSNIDRENNIAKAIQQLQQHFGTLNISPTYESSSIDGKGNDYFNLCVGFQSPYSFGGLRSCLRKIEERLGRDRTRKNYVTIDMDILLFDDLVQSDGETIIPNPEILTKAHVITPLNDIAENFLHPTLNKVIKEIFSSLTFQSQPKRVIRRQDVAESRN